MNGRSTSSNDAILNAPTSSASSSSTAWRSNGELMNWIALLAAVLGEDRLPIARQRDLLEQLVRGLVGQLVVEVVEAGRLVE